MLCESEREESDDIREFIERALQSHWEKVEALIDALPGRVLQKLVAERGDAERLNTMTHSAHDSNTQKGLETVSVTQEALCENAVADHQEGEKKEGETTISTVVQAPPVVKSAEKNILDEDEDEELKVSVGCMMESVKSMFAFCPEGGIRGYLKSVKNDPDGFAHFVDGNVFAFISSIAIFANTIYIGWETDTNMGNEVSRFHEGTQTSVSPVPEYAFICFFVVELLLRALAKKRLFLLGRDRNWNFFDFVLIFLSLVQTVANTGSNLSVFRIFRIFRLARLLKVIRRMKIQNLNLMVFGIINCFAPLFWATIILIIVMYAFGVFFMSVTVSYLEARGGDDITDSFLGELDLKFGSMYKTMCTLFEAISGGNDWASLALELKEIGEGAYICFALYIVFITLGVLNIVTGFFVDNTLEASTTVKEELLKEAQERKNAIVAMVGELFHQMDDDKSGKLSVEELETHLYDEDLQSYFTILEMEATEARDLFMLLDTNGTGEVSIDDFTKGCLKVMGAPRNLDICTCLFQSKRMLAMMESAANPCL